MNQYEVPKSNRVRVAIVDHSLPYDILGIRFARIPQLVTVQQIMP